MAKGIKEVRLRFAENIMKLIKADKEKTRKILQVNVLSWENYNLWKYNIRGLKQ